jgi:hypothetical protein
MWSRPKGSRQSSQKDHRCNADTPSTKGMSSRGRSALLGGVESQTASAVEREAEDAKSKPSYVEWEAREMATHTTTGDRTTVAGVVADKLFQKAKFVDRDFDLGFDETEGSICKFVTTYCNLQASIDECTWWTYISRIRNDKSTAMKWAFLGTYYLIVYAVLPEIKRG